MMDIKEVLLLCFMFYVPWTYVISDLNGAKLLEHFMKKNCKKQIKKNLGQKK